MFVKVDMNFWSQHKTLDNKSHHDDNRPEDKRGKWHHPGMSVASFIERVYHIPYQRWPPLRVLVWTGLLPGWNQAPEECPAMRHFGVLCGEQRSYNGGADTNPMARVACMVPGGGVVSMFSGSTTHYRIL